MIVTLASVRATGCELRIPQVGAWIADVDMDSADALPAGKLTLAIGATTFVGTVDARFSGTFAGRRRVRLVAGAGGWAKVLAAKFFHNDAGIADKKVIETTAAEAGETLSFVGTPTAAGRTSFARSRGPGRAVLDVLATSGWYVDFTGVTQVGARAVTKLGEFQLLDFDSRQNIATIATNDAKAVGIGATLTDRLDAPLVVRDIRLTVSDDGARVFAWGTTQ